MACCGLAPYGRREWLGATAVAAIAGTALGLLAWRVSWLCLLPGVPVALLWLWVLWFFRDPQRVVPDGPGLFVSPADGTVTDVTPVGADSPLGTEGVRIGVFMSIFDVHVNRAPCDGHVESVEHRDGVFLDARKPNAAFRNESTTIRLTHALHGADYPVVVRQVAGLIARRIVTDLREGQAVRRGERMGMIKFGSRLELLVPRALAGAVRVAVGDRAVAGRTVLVAALAGPSEGTHGQPTET